MSLQNRVDPFGEIHVCSARGGLMGNRGGKLHLPDKTLGRRRWVSKSWIACTLDFRGRRRQVMSSSYTELFFMDEATALAAGHRPCFECRNADARAFADAWGASKRLNRPARAWEMDVVLHAERIERGGGAGARPGRGKRVFPAKLDDLPAGAMISLWGATWLVAHDFLLRWSFDGYAQAIRRPANVEVNLLTPPSIVEVLKRGYAPMVASPLF